MSTPAPTPDTPRPERTLPTEPGWWWTDNVNAPVWVGQSEVHGGLCVPVDDGNPYPLDTFTWLAPIPTPEQLAAQAAKVAAGQALADAVRRWQAADELWRDLKHGDDLRAAGEASNLMFEAESALRTVDLAAFPAGGAR